MDTQGTISTQGTTDIGYSAFIDTQRKMNQIIYQMKEHPDIPSEQMNDVNPLEKVEFPEEGGVLTYMGGHPFPYKGFPFAEFVQNIDYIKKILRGTLSGFYHSFKRRKKILFLTLIPSLWIAKDSVRVGVYTVFRLVDRFKVKPRMYSKSMRELYRAFSYERYNENPQEREFRLQLRDVVCMLLEFDNAYRFRFQDVIEDLNKDLLVKNPRKEILRLLGILKSRELQQEVIDTWRLFEYLVRYYLVFDKKLLGIIKDVFYQLDISQLLLDEADKHFCLPRKDYKFKFQQ